MWRTVGDNKVRKEHRALDGTIRAFGEFPEPGEEHNCRCMPKPVSRKDLKDNTYCHDLWESIQELREKLSEILGRQSEHRARIDEIETQIKDIEEQFSDIFGLPTSDDVWKMDPTAFRRFAAKWVGYIGFAVDVMEIVKLYDEKQKLEDQKTFHASQIERLEKELEKTNKTLEEKEKELDNNCPVYFS